MIVGFKTAMIDGKNFERPALSDYLSCGAHVSRLDPHLVRVDGIRFVAGRFELFPEKLQLLENHAATHSYGLSVWFGTSLIFAVC